ncbi:MerR family transcriptional regulator [Vibrio sp. MACH09]|uniref:MerR family transcriptional regulator n=1 Tax=Vibrio sp. MACH09 TaxID=3025122 RepID=UPI00295EFF1F|nr:MerR family transcriptional regulator [Vibrio sp. MACH09]
MRVGELCRRAGVSKELVRHYESIGLIESTPEPAGSKNYRQFSEHTVERLDLIKKAKALGLSLSEIKPLLDAFVQGDMSRQQAILLLEERDQHMLEIINNAESVRTLIAQNINKLKQQLLKSCLDRFND